MHKFKYDIEKETGIPWKKKKSYRYLYTLACQKGVILRAFKRMKRGKSDRKDIQMVEEFHKKIGLVFEGNASKKIAKTIVDHCKGDN